MKLQDFRKFRDVTLIQPQRVNLVLPAFTLPASTWAGASVILAEYAFNNTVWFSLMMPIGEFGSNFVPAVRYVNGDMVARYKLWEDVGELLYYPVYDGERLGPNAVVEIWSVNSPLAPMNPANVTFLSSVVNVPEDTCSTCCTNPSETDFLVYQPPQIISPYAACDPFCLPLQTF